MVFVEGSSIPLRVPLGLVFRVPFKGSTVGCPETPKLHTFKTIHRITLCRNPKTISVISSLSRGCGIFGGRLPCPHSTALEHFLKLVAVTGYVLLV